MKKITFTFLFFFVAAISLFAQSSGNKFGNFTTVDVNGNPVTQDIFARKDVTIINVWGTYCGPCIKEMPELGEFEKSLPQNTQLIGIVVDVSSEKDKRGTAAVKRIVKGAGAEFKNLLISNTLAGNLQNLQFVPTTLLVDKNGNIIGDPIVGANVRNYKKALEAYLDGKK